MESGDENTKFFHSKASTRKCHNAVKTLQNSEGEWFTDFQGMSHSVFNYFTKLFSPIVGDYEDVLSCISPSINEEDNRHLTEPFTTTEFKHAIFSMHLDKSPSFDGFNPSF